MNDDKADTREAFTVQGAAPEGDPRQTDAVDMADSAALLANLSAERDQLAQERAELYDRLLRLRAEFDNYRRRAERERSEYLEFAGMEAVRAVIPILDDFERALRIESADREYAKGMELIYNRLVEALKKTGLEPMAARGEKFDPHLHQAVTRETTDEVEDNTVLEELQKGYNFKGKLLRPAMVKVAVHP